MKRGSARRPKVSNLHAIKLGGCAPDPLLHYLKALGILRLVVEQADADARGCWELDRFVLYSALSRNNLIEFFFDRYAPTPILGPWAGGSGFFGNDNRDAVQAILGSQCERLRAYREEIGRVHDVLKAEGVKEKPSGAIKSRLLRRYRREMSDSFVRWMDSAIALELEGETFAPLWGSGGNDGRLDFTQNFMQRIVTLKFHEERPNHAASSLLESSLFGTPTLGLGKASVGQFAPGRAGGPNGTQGMEADSMDNPWDYLLGLEGALLLSTAAVRRLGAVGNSRTAFPFAVRSRPVGAAMSTDGEAAEARDELWLPLWGRPASSGEVELMLGEGRADLGGRPAQDAVEFSRAVAELGTDRGIDSFCRYGFLKRSGKSYLAVFTERFHVPTAKRSSIDLLRSIDRWLSEFRSRANSDGPERLRIAVRRIESAIFDFCRSGSSAQGELQRVLIALGAAERELALTGGVIGGKSSCRPVPILRSVWISAADDRSPEFEIALALAGIHRHQRNRSDTESLGEEATDDITGVHDHQVNRPSDQFPPIRENLEPVKKRGYSCNWDEEGQHVVWNRGNLAENLIAVLDRRLRDGGKASLGFKRGVRLETIAKFLTGDVDDNKIEALLWALTLVESGDSSESRFQASRPGMLPPAAFALLKPLFLPWPIQWKARKWQYGSETAGSIDIGMEPRVLPLIRAERVMEACRIASRRLLVSGLAPMLGHSSHATPHEIPSEIEVGIDPKRLAASLLLPIHNDELDSLLHLAIRPHDEASEMQGVDSYV